MKKIRLFLLTAATALFAASCSEDNVFTPTTGDGNVTFDVTVSTGTGSRAVIGDGLQAKNLKYAVYDASNSNLVSEGSASFGNSLSTKLTIPLVNGKTYKIAFFAYNNSNVYAFDADAKTVSVNYDQMMTTSSHKIGHDHDCFYTVEELTVTGPVSRTVTLKRPVAQINWGSDDLGTDAVVSAYGTSLRSKFVGKAYSTLNLLTGEASDEVEIKQNTARAIVPTDIGTFPVEGYDYLSYYYVLVPKDQSILMDCKLELYKGSSTLIHTVEVTNVPVQRNFRTNIYGSLLTSQADITVEKDPSWDTPDNNVEIWKGEIKTPAADADGNYGIGNAGELAGIALMVNSGNNLAGKTVYLKNDIDLNNLNWTPIGNKTNAFQGHFDGKGFTIKNLNINLAGKNATYTGLIGYSWQSNATFKDITIDGAAIDLRGQIGDACPASVFFGGGAITEIINVTVKNAKINSFRQTGAIAGNIYANVKNCKVMNTEITVEPEQLTNGTWDNGDKAGALIGMTGEERYTISGNKAENVKVTAFRDLGGMFGMLHDNNIYTDNTISNSEVIVSLKNADKLGRNWENAGEIVGRSGSPVTDGGGNAATNVTVFKPTQNVENLEGLSAAITNGGYISIKNGATITVPGSVDIVNPTTIDIPASATIVMEQPIYNKSEMVIRGEGTVTSSTYAIINNGGTLTIEDGKFLNTGNDIKYQSVRNESGDMVINGGYFEANVGAAVMTNFVNGDTGTLTINGGTFITQNSGQYALQMNGDGEFTINGGTFAGEFGGARVEGGAHATINGGDFISFGKGKSFYALAVNPEATNSYNSTVIVNGGNFWSNNATLYCRDGSALTLRGGNFKELNGYAPAAGFVASDVTLSKTFTIGDNTIECTYTKSVVKE